MKYSRPTGAPPWFYWFHKTYDKERIEADLENIRDLYRDHGYYLRSGQRTGDQDGGHPAALSLFLL